MTYNIDFQLTQPLKPLHKLYIEQFFKKIWQQHHIEHDRLNNDPLIRLLGLPKTSEFFCNSNIGFNEPWTKESHKYYTNELNDIVFTLLCIQKFYMKHIDKNIFLKILSFIADNQNLSYLNFDLERNINLISFGQINCNVCKNRWEKCDSESSWNISKKIFDLVPYENPYIFGIKLNISNDNFSFTIESVDKNIESLAKFIQNKLLSPWNYLSTYKITFIEPPKPTYDYSSDYSDYSSDSDY